MRIRKGDAARIVFYLSDADDNETGETGITPSITLSKNGGAFSSATNAGVEIANGWYYVDLTTTETNTAGSIIFKATGAGANDWLEIHEVYDTVLLDEEVERVADIVIRRHLDDVLASSSGDTLDISSLLGMILLTMNSAISGNTITVKKLDASTLGTITIGVDGSGNLTSKTL